VPDGVAHHGAGCPAPAARGSAAGLSPVGRRHHRHEIRPAAFDPVTLLGVELAAATAVLWAVLLIRGYRPPPSWPAAVLLGLLEPALVVILAAPVTACTSIPGPVS